MPQQSGFQAPEIHIDAALIAQHEREFNGPVPSYVPPPLFSMGMYAPPLVNGPYPPPPPFAALPSAQHHPAGCLTEVPSSLPARLASDWELCSTGGQTQVIGTGAYAVVCLVRKRATGQAYALKVIAEAPLAIRGLLPQVRDEMEHHRVCVHPNITRMFEATHADGHFYMISELAQHGSLEQLLGRVQGGWLHLTDAAFFLKHLVGAVAYLHSDSVQILHRDIKEANVLIVSSQCAQLTDFGFSIRLSDHQLPSGHAGSVSHMAPEVLKGHSYGLGADCWSMGVVLYRMLSGRLPFDNPQASMQSLYVQLPADWVAHAGDLVKQLLCLDASKRMRAKELLTHVFVVSAPRLLSLSLIAAQTLPLPEPATNIVATSTRPMGGVVLAAAPQVVPVTSYIPPLVPATSYVPPQLPRSISFEAASTTHTTPNFVPGPQPMLQSSRQVRVHATRQQVRVSMPSSAMRGRVCNMPSSAMPFSRTGVRMAGA